jgi:hypothetical protein
VLFRSWDFLKHGCIFSVCVCMCVYICWVSYLGCMVIRVGFFLIPLTIVQTEEYNKKHYPLHNMTLKYNISSHHEIFAITFKLISNSFGNMIPAIGNIVFNY